MTLTHTVA